MKRGLLWFGLAGLVLAGQAAAKSHFVIVGGLGGEARYAKQWSESVDGLNETCRKTAGDDALVHVLKGKAATKEAIEAVFAGLRRETAPSDIVSVFLIGHGSYDGHEYRFNIPGRDLTAAEIKGLLDSLPAKDQLIAITTSSSGASVEELKADRRIVITATKSAGERTVTVFAEHWVEALRDAEADTNKDEVITALEAFTYADKKVQDFYALDKRMATEHARLEGELAASFTLTRLGSALDAASDPKLRPLLERRGGIERRIAELKNRKDAMETAAYTSELQKLLVELARTQAEIDTASGRDEQ
ncbi:MAG: hypothetical protein O2968_03865 [Acidobacteria bacterium]|nr:hypothetical protein [Acidobacteriota bacterium]